MPSVGQPVNDYWQEMIAVGPFGGLDTTTEPYFVSPNNFVNGQNFVPNSGFGGFVTAEGRSVFLAAPLPGGVYGIHGVERSGLPTLYLFSVLVAGVGYIYGAVQGGVPYNIPTPAPLLPPIQMTFADSVKWVFINDGVNTPLKYEVTTGIITYWGIVAPTPIGGPFFQSGPGPLNGTYYYNITFEGNGVESSPSTFTGPIIAVNGSITINGIPGSTDPQVTTVNIYRLGGSLGQWLFVGSIPIGTNTYTDSTSDTALSGNLVETLRRDPPPIFTAICVHQERVWGFGTTTDPSLVYFSNYNEPWAFDTVQGFYPVNENNFNDIAVGLCSIGSQLILFKSKTTYQVTGNTSADFQVNKLFDIGCRSLRSITKSYGVCWWLSKQGIYQFDGNSPTNLSDGGYQQSNIKSVLDALTDNDFSNCTSFVYDRMVHFSLPTLNITYFWDLRSQGWYQLGWALDQVYFNLEADTPVIGTDLEASGQIDLWFSGPGDFGNPILAYILSRITDSGTMESTKDYRYIEIQAPVQVGTVTISTMVDPGTLQFTDVSAFDLSSGFVRQQGSLPRGALGAEVQIKVLVSSLNIIHIQKVAIHGYMKAKYRSRD
jgi:hypothetical protein